VDAVIVATPHYYHPIYVTEALKRDIHVMSEKPAGVYTKAVREVNELAARSKATYAIMFNQRTNCVYRKMKEIVSSGELGNIRRVNWLSTNWYRSQAYYDSGAWRATWDGEGGGVLMNQCPHNLDLLQWICGMPARVRGFCREGRYHDIQVEDDVTLYMEWENGATGTFISSTGEAPGINRLEISLEEAMLVCDRGVLKIGELYPELGMKEEEYRKTSDDYFRKIHGTWSEASVPAADENP
jgi:predicted dehydrogenase